MITPEGAVLSADWYVAGMHSCPLLQVLPEVYGGEAALVPVEEAALQRLAQQRHRQLTKAARKKPAAAAGPKSSRIASAGRVIHRWSSSAWGVAKKPAVVCSEMAKPFQYALTH